MTGDSDLIGRTYRLSERAVCILDITCVRLKKQKSELVEEAIIEKYGNFSEKHPYK
jgi:hypothetical protein